MMASSSSGGSMFSTSKFQVCSFTSRSFLTPLRDTAHAASCAGACSTCSSATLTPIISTRTAFSYSLFFAISSLLISFLLSACTAIRESFCSVRSMSSSSIARLSSSSSCNSSSLAPAVAKSIPIVVPSEFIKDWADPLRPASIFSRGFTSRSLSTVPRSIVMNIMTRTMMNTSVISMAAEIRPAFVKLNRIAAFIVLSQLLRESTHSDTSMRTSFLDLEGLVAAESRE
mmetsp:Transcript_67948/g.159337  ORF Transcript_67948/g.159337 Transcript_67948/m.159337 type:complete len:229 (-) Transcript_67948:5-691(-)